MNAETKSRRRTRISLLYYSGTGGTKLVAELLGELLAARYEVCLASVHEQRALELAGDSDFLVLFYPTFFLRPAPSMREFIERLCPFDPPRAAYVVTTDELYSENSIRACALLLKLKGISVVGSKVIRAPGSDVTCVVPGRLLPWLYRFERSFPRKLRAIVEEIGSLADSRALAGAGGGRVRIPLPKWYTPFAQALQVLALNRFTGWRDKFRVLAERCSSCGACAARCDRGAWVLSGEGPSHIPERCELCTRCIHRCPEKAIVLIEGLKDNPRLDARLYASLKAEARRDLAKYARLAALGAEGSV